MKKLIVLLYVFIFFYISCEQGGPLYLALHDDEIGFGVESIDPNNGSNNIVTDSKITITFSETVTGLSMQSSNGACTGTVQLSFNDFNTCLAGTINKNGNPKIEITPADVFFPCKTYKIKILSSVSSIESEETLSKDYITHIGFSTQGNTTWTEFDNNPIIQGGSTDGVDRAYYPWILKINNEYHMWVGDGAQTRFAKSYYPDFRDRVYPNDFATLTGDVSDNVAYPYTYHPVVLYKQDGWTINSVSYTDPFLLYITPNFDSVYVFRSVDGLNWTLIGQIENVTDKPNGSGTGYQATNAYTFVVLYEDDTHWKAYSDDGGGTLHYYTSSDGFTWTGVQHQVLGGYQVWESYDSRLAPFVISYNSEYLIFYSSGTGNNNESIGMGVSNDGGQNFIPPINYIFSIDDGIAWRDSRSYTPRLVQDEAIGSESWLMYFTGKTSATGSYNVGLSYKCSVLEE